MNVHVTWQTHKSKCKNSQIYLVEVFWYSLRGPNPISVSAATRVQYSVPAVKFVITNDKVAALVMLIVVSSRGSLDPLSLYWTIQPVIGTVVRGLYVACWIIDVLKGEKESTVSPIATIKYNKIKYNHHNI